MDEGWCPAILYNYLLPIVLSFHWIRIDCGVSEDIFDTYTMLYSLLQL